MKKSTYLLTLLLTALFCLPWGSNAWGGALTVSDGTTQNEYHPIYGYYCDDASHHNQVLYTISEFSSLADMTGKQITKMEFYSSNASSSWGSLNVNIKLAEVSESALSGFNTTSALTSVYSGPISVSGNKMVIEFTEPFDYSGGNLLFDLTISAQGSYQHIKFYGVGTYDYIYGYKKDGDGSKSSYFVPKTTFTYEAAGSATCPKPTDLTCTALAATSASFTWNAGGTEGEWQYLCLPATTTADWESAAVKTATAASVSVEDLTPSTEYKFYVRANCGGSDGQSAAVSAAFKTPCVAVSTLPWNDEDFADVTTGSSVYNIPDCWDRIAYESSWYGTMPYVQNGSSGHSGSGSKYLYFYGGQTPAAIILPTFAEKTGKLAVSFWYKSDTYTYYGDVQIGYMTDPTDASSFTLLKTLDKVADWTFVNAFAMTGAPDDSYIAIRFAGGTSDYCSLYIDDISVDLAPSCLAPSAPTASDITINSAKLTWTANSGESAWTLQYSTDGETWSAEQAVSDNPYTLSSLSTNTLYYVRVKAVCSGSDESAYSEIGSFRTACGTMAALDEKFDTYSASSRPACWEWITYNDGWDDYPMVSASNAFSGSNSLAFSGGGSAAATFAVLPKFEDPINTLALWFYYKNSSTYASYAQLKVGYMLDPAVAGTFVEVATLEKTTDYTKVGPFTFSEAPTDAYIAIQFGGGSSNYGAAYIDNVVVAEAPSCIQPGNLSASSITDEGAVISWNAGGSETAWTLQYKRYDGDWSADINVTTASYTLTDLDANTNYYVRVKALCGGEDVSDWTNSLNFKTTCGVNALPFEEDFGSTSAVPDCWTVGKNGGSYQWTPTYDTYPNYYLYFRTGSGSTYSYLTLPAIELTEDAQLTFDWRNSNNVTADLLISTDGGVTFTSIPNHGLSTTASSWTAKKYDLSAYTGETVIISIRGYNGTSSRYLRIDNIRVEAKPCEALAAPTAAPTIDGGTISWTGNAKALRYQAVGASTWNTVAVTGTSYLLTGLEASTSYNVQVQAACATGDDDLWSNSLTFATRCAATDELPYSNNFDAEESNELPACWSKISATDYPYVYSGAAAYGGTGKFLYFYGSTEQIAVLPALTADLSTLTFSLYYKGGSANFQLGYVKADGVTFVDMETLPALTAFGAEPYELDLASIPAEAKYLAIRYNSTSNYASGYVDNVVVKKTPTCFKPASIAASAITANSATVAWTASGKGETQYQYVCVPAGETPDWAAATLTDELSATLTTLAPTTAYDFYVRSYCGTEDQSDAVKTSFTTKCAAAALPFDEDFDAVADYDMPECWNVYAATYYSAYVANGQLRADAPKTNATVIVLPELEASFVGASVAFNYSTSNGTLEVGYVTDAEDKSSFVAVSEALTAVSTTQVLVPFTAGSGNIAFRFIGNTGEGDLYLDNIRVSNTLVMANDEDNTAALAANNGQTLDVQINRTFYADGYFNTVCLPFSLPTLDGTPLEGGELLAFKYGYVENGELLLRVYPTEAIEAGVPYLISWAEGSDIVSPLFKSVTIAASAGKSVGENDDVKFVGIFAPDTFQLDDKTKLFMLANNQIAWSGYDGHSLKSFRAYFQTNTPVGTEPSNAPIRHGMPARIVMGEQIATGCENIQGGQVQSLKVLENNQVVIIRNGVKYNLQGQKIQ
ncbi:MAG: fibronectin type III domain-containing protein [Paludibacteraceae bacterium]|nr:fibronectin type III domain-containing protein [Paludibacteraceae bacterium]